MAKKDIEIGVNAVQENEPKSFDVDNSDARKKRIEEARKLLKEYPPEEDLSEKNIEEKPTTFGGMFGGAERALAPYAAAAGIGALGGAPFAGVGAIPGAATGVAAVGLSDAAIGITNALTGKKFENSQDALGHLFNWAGIPDAQSSAEKIVKKAAETGGAVLGGASAAGKLSEIVKSPVAKGVLGALGEKPIEQAVAGTAMGGAGQLIKEFGGEPWQQVTGELATGVIAPAALKSLSLPERVLPKTWEALKGLDLSKIGQGIKTAFSPTESARNVLPEDINKTLISATKGDVEAKRRLAEAGASMTPEVKQAIEKTGLEISPELTSASPEFRGVAQTVASVPQSQLARTQTESIQELSKNAENTLEKLKATKDLSTLSSDVKDSITNSIKRHSEKEDELYSLIREKAPAETEMEAKSSVDAVLKRIKDLRGREEALSPIEKSILQQLSPRPVSNEAGKIIGYTHPSIEGIYTLKKKIGAFLDKEYVFPTEEIGNAKRYYGLVSDDFNEGIKKFGLQDEYESAKSLTKFRKNLEDNAIDLFGKKLSDSISGKISGSAQAAAKGDADKIRNILNLVPDKMKQEVTASAINSAITKGGEFNISNFSKWYGGLKANKESYNALFEHLPESAKSEIDDLYAISKNINDSLSGRVQTGKLTEALKQSEGLASRIRKIAKAGALGAAVGIPLKIGAAALGAGHGILSQITSAITGAVAGSAAATSKTKALQAADDFLSSPEFAKLVKASAGNPTEFSRAYTLIEKTPLWNRFVKETGLTAAQRASLFSPKSEKSQSSEDQIESGLNESEAQ